MRTLTRTTGRALIWLLTGLLLLSPLQAVSVMAQTLTEEELEGLPGYEVLISDLTKEGAALNPEAPAYGAMEPVAVEGQSFSNGIRFITNTEPQGTYLLQYVMPVEAAIEKDDVMLASFYARTISSTHETAEGKVALVMEKRETWEKSVTETMSVPSEWKRFLVPIKAALAMEANTPQVALRLGFKPQAIEIADLKVVNYKKSITIDQLPSTPVYYEGMEEDAPWRAEADARIEQLRKGDLQVRVVDNSGQPVSGANVHVAMTDHAFKFGTAVNSSLLMGNGADAETYRAKLKENFNSVVMENEMKWAWWEADKARTANMYNWLGENGFDIRGHALLWDGPTRMPADIGGLLGDKEALDKRIRDHFHELAGYFQGRLFDWDVLNEPVLNKMIRGVHGDAYMADWFKWAKEADPEAKLFLNETQILGVNAPVIANLSNLLETLKEHGAPIDGVGIQAHFGSTPVAPMDFYGQLTHFAGYVPEIAITEFDFNTPREDIAAMFTRDLLIATFSHPNVTSFTMWGFWDGAHWQNNAPLFRGDWSLKPSGEEWRKLIYETWWTDESGETDADGRFATRGFYGDYDITVSHGGKNKTVKASLARNGDNAVIVNLDDEGEQPAETFEPIAIPSQTADVTSPAWPYGSSFGASGASPTSVTLEWPQAYDNRGVAGYNVYRDGSLLTTLPADTTRFDVTELVPGGRYSFTVEAYDEAGNVSLPSPPITAEASSADDSTLPGWTKGSFLTLSDLTRSGFKLAWPAAVDNDGAKGYRIYVNGNIAGDAETLGYELSGLRDDTLYTVRVEAKDWEGNLSAGGPIVTFRTPGSADVTQPAWSGTAALTASAIGMNELTLAWDSAQDAGGVTAYRLTMGGEALTVVPASESSYRVTGLSPHTSYAFAVEAGDGAGNWSLVLTAAIATGAGPDAESPSWPKDRKLAYASLTDRSVTMNWTEATDNVGVAGYRVYRDGELAGSMSSEERSFVATGLTPGETYAFSVEAVDDAGNWTTDGPAVEVTAFEGVQRNEYVVYPDADAFVQAPATFGGAGTNNNPNYLRYKNAAGVSGSEQNKNTGNNRRAYLRFPLESVTGDVYEAVLRLYVFAVQTPNMDIGMDLYATGDEWTETGLVWNNKPADGEKLASATIRNAGYWKELEVGAYVSGEAAGDGTASFKLQDDAWLDQNVDFHSREASGANAAYRPQLVIRSEQVPSDDNAPSWAGGELDAGEITPYSVKLAWSGAADDRGINGYVVYRDGVAVAETGADARSLTVSGLSASRTYGFAVEAKDGAGNLSTTGPSREVTTPEADGEAPAWGGGAELQASSIGRHDAVLTWTPATDNYGVAGYAVYLGDTLLSTVGGAAASYRATGLTPGTTYGFRVAAIDVAGNEADGPTLDVATLAADTSAPAWSGGSALTASEPTTSGFSLSWPAAVDDTGISRYRVYLDGEAVAVLPGSVHGYYVNGLLDGLAYEATVEAVDAAGNVSAPLALDDVRTPKRDTVTPQWPTGSRLIADFASEPERTLLRWDEAIDNEGVASYAIYRNGVAIAAASGQATEHEIEGSADRDAVYKVEAIDLAGNATVFGPATSDPVIPVPTDSTPPGWPAGSEARTKATSPTSVALSWSEAIDRMSEVSYRVYLDGKLIATTEGNEWVVTGLSPQTEYTFKIEAEDEEGNWTTNGPGLNVATPGAVIEYPSGPPAGAGTPVIEVRDGGVGIRIPDALAMVSGESWSA
jgi:GH35 family endo-1,4-beta-xylanase/chitodextrinase